MIAKTIAELKLEIEKVKIPHRDGKPVARKVKVELELYTMDPTICISFSALDPKGDYVDQTIAGEIIIDVHDDKPLHVCPPKLKNRRTASTREAINLLLKGYRQYLEAFAQLGKRRKKKALKKKS